MFWAQDKPPKDWEKASSQYGVKTLDEMDAATKADVATLNSQEADVPCDASSGTLKCTGESKLQILNMYTFVIMRAGCAFFLRTGWRAVLASRT